ncbi:MAG: GNAT family N-acetyltransferase [Scytonematopsis contorta HA4267-MV1]|jgi:GNAT superfamily N-acetyltransferase|nr:GNAT family N-acetyltransferase [Scytonematopsis contorta HA4267-MV1]
MYKLISLSLSIAEAYEELTYPRFRPLLQKLTPENRVVAIAAECHGEPVGLVLGQYFPMEENKNYFAVVRSLFVVPEYRQQGVGKNLLLELEAELARRGCIHVSLEYLTSQTSGALEQILKQNHWSEPQFAGMICHSPDVKHDSASYLNRVLRTPLPPDYSIFFWKDLTEQELSKLKQQDYSHLRYPDLSNPFLEEHYIEPLNSLGMRYHSQIIGWMITHRLAPDLIRYTTLYIQPEFQPLSRSLHLMMQAIKIQADDGIVPRAIFNVNGNNLSMQRYVKYRLSPWLDSVRERFEVYKSLQPTHRSFE